jgi:hypothetical protein
MIMGRMGKDASQAADMLPNLMTANQLRRQHGVNFCGDAPGRIFRARRLSLECGQFLITIDCA